MKIYLSGKITGDGNYKAKFSAMAEKLKALGYAVFNPAVLPDGFEYEDYMKIDLCALSTCEGIFLLDDWKDSPGAVREYEAARELNLEVFTESDLILHLDERESA